MSSAVVWINFAPLQHTPAGPTSSLASARYRMLLPAAALAGLDCPSRVVSVSPLAARQALERHFDGARAAIVGKLALAEADFPRAAEQTLQLLQALRGRGVRILADFCDDHFAHPVRGPYFRELARDTDLAIAGTPAMAQALADHTRAPVAVIGDPVEGARGAPRTAAAEAPLNLLWFGHPTNIPTLRFALPQLDRLGRALRCTLVLITSDSRDARALAARIDQIWSARGSRCRFVPWSTRAVFEALAECDAVLIPSDPQDPRKAVKSANRFSEGLWAGRFVLAHPLPAYVALADFGSVGADLGAGIEWLLGNREEARQRIEAGQRFVAEHLTPHAIATQWRAAIESAWQVSWPR